MTKIPARFPRADHALDPVKIPKKFLTGIYVDWGPAEGVMAQPCICGYETDPEGDEPVHLIQWHDGRVMYCHERCVGRPDNA